MHCINPHTNRHAQVKLEVKVGISSCVEIKVGVQLLFLVGGQKKIQIITHFKLKNDFQTNGKKNDIVHLSSLLA